MRIAFLGNFGVSYTSETHHAASLEALGHDVIRLQEPKATAEQISTATQGADLFVWVHTHSWPTPGIEDALARIRADGVPIIAYHLDLYIGLARWAEYRNDPYMKMLDHFFTVDRLMADWLNNNTPVKGHYMPAGVFGPECYIAPPIIGEKHPFANDVIFVGQRNYHPEWPYRPQLIDWLQETYGDRFTRIAGDQPSGTVRGYELNRLYADSKVVVGDSLCPNFDYPDYWSDRVYETLGRGGFLIHPYVKGMEREFDDNWHLKFYQYGDFTSLKELIDYYLGDGAGKREAIRELGHQHVKNFHTYTDRWREILWQLGLK